jgi:hypothetical protein
MAERVTLEARRAGLASRLRPLYAGLRADEFERMVARIAEIELNEPYALAAPPVDVDALRAPRASRRTTRANERTPITGAMVGVGAQGSRRG